MPPLLSTPCLSHRRVTPPSAPAPPRLRISASPHHPLPPSLTQLDGTPMRGMRALLSVSCPRRYRRWERAERPRRINRQEEEGEGECAKVRVPCTHLYLLLLLTHYIPTCAVSSALVGAEGNYREQQLPHRPSFLSLSLLVPRPRVHSHTPPYIRPQTTDGTYCHLCAMHTYVIVSPYACRPSLRTRGLVQCPSSAPRRISTLLPSPLPHPYPRLLSCSPPTSCHTSFHS
ncbi:hypothetical protein DFH08DRAFT_884591 [Mycena albidolilacea]|uniref:Uncharacterized protein n=1 Tax=Mycena albidolilacea TaxID=1033008 RepID=A0AAD6ZK85_9AGAR|nr:hypothetical protein DFH08DRAFT_884591 [Mycena albidolilacea]